MLASGSNLPGLFKAQSPGTATDRYRLRLAHLHLEKGADTKKSTSKPKQDKTSKRAKTRRKKDPRKSDSDGKSDTSLSEMHSSENRESDWD